MNLDTGVVSWLMRGESGSLVARHATLAGCVALEEMRETLLVLVAGSEQEDELWALIQGSPLPDPRLQLSAYFA